jgi:hypothetical protein
MAIRLPGTRTHIHIQIARPIVAKVGDAALAYVDASQRGKEVNRVRQYAKKRKSRIKVAVVKIDSTESRLDKSA